MVMSGDVTMLGVAEGGATTTLVGVESVIV